MPMANAGEPLGRVQGKAAGSRRPLPSTGRWLDGRGLCLKLALAGASRSPDAARGNLAGAAAFAAGGPAPSSSSPSSRLRRLDRPAAVLPQPGSLSFPRPRRSAISLCGAAQTPKLPPGSCRPPRHMQAGAPAGRRGRTNAGGSPGANTRRRPSTGTARGTGSCRPAAAAAALRRKSSARAGRARGRPAAATRPRYPAPPAMPWPGARGRAGGKRAPSACPIARRPCWPARSKRERARGAQAPRRAGLLPPPTRRRTAPARRGQGAADPDSRNPTLSMDYRASTGNVNP